MSSFIVVNLAMSHEYWNTINLLTSALLLLWLLRSFRNFYRICRLRSAITSGRVVQVRGLGSYLSYLADAMPNHANHIMHTRQVEPPTGVPSIYNPYTVGKINVSVTTGSNSYDTKLRYQVEFSTSVPCKVMAMTDVNVETFKEKVEDGGFGPGLGSGGLRSPTTGRSRSNSRSNLKGGGRSRSSSRASVYEESWIETLEKEDDAAGGLGMGMHGLFERHRVCHSTSRLASVGVGEHTLDLETQVLNLDRYVAPNLPLSPSVRDMASGVNITTDRASVGDMELGNSGVGLTATHDNGQTPPSSKPSVSIQSVPSEVTFALLVIPQGYSEVDLDISPPETAYNLALKAAGLPDSGLVPSPSAIAVSLGGNINPEIPPSGGTGASGSGSGALSRTSGPNLFTSLFRESSLRSSLAPSPAPATGARGAGVHSGHGSGDVGAEANAQDDPTAPNLTAIAERKSLLPREAMEMSYAMLTMTGQVKNLTEMVQTARSQSSGRTTTSTSSSSSEGKEGVTETSLAAKDYYIGCNGRCYNTLEIFGLQSESSSSSTFLQSTVLAREKVNDATTTSTAAGAAKEPAGGGFDDDCVICMCDIKSIMLLPCRHFCVCPACLIKIDKCPVCRAPFDEYLSITKGDRSGSEIVIPTLLAKKNL